jgi:hypothetical protein
MSRYIKVAEIKAGSRDIACYVFTLCKSFRPVRFPWYERTLLTGTKVRSVECMTHPKLDIARAREAFLYRFTLSTVK